MNCNLCSGEGELFYKINDIKYYKCSKCNSVFMDSQNYLTYEEEKSRYEKHNNDVEDIRYQEFVADIVEEVKQRWDNKYTLGLDFGAGTGPVISKLLRDDGYDIETYDPFFCNKENLLNKNYDYIVTCEVIEHFHNPLKEFELLYSLLKEGGMLYCKTEIYSDDIDFKNWYYKDDHTHVFFYHEKAFKWMVENIGYKSYSIVDRVIVLTK
ncbi:MAG: class I SAM-dependent methyltransferase [Bacillota bacterium]|nr:class I SAM-dependent methyltransferase [Bacillota bacterium]